jgi:predicted GH43/DUF377 family glycosyl hydrolase
MALHAADLPDAAVDRRPVTPLSDRSWVRRTDHVLEPDLSRVVSTLFLPGQETESGESRSNKVIHRVMELSDDEVTTKLARLSESFGHRHRGLRATWQRNFELVGHRLDDVDSLSGPRKLLIGAYFTQEYALEGAALFNPSMVPHPDQSGLPDGTTRFLMTIRAVGEGHISSIEFRTGTIDNENVIVLDPEPSVAVLGHPVPATFSRASFRHQLRELVGERTNVDFVLDGLPESFTRHDLDGALDDLHDQRLTRGKAERTRAALQIIAGNTYAREFTEGTPIQERVLMPMGPAESQGMEDARMVRFAGYSGTPAYLGTYTAFDGRDVTTQLLTTDEFRCFTFERLSGPGSKNKGMAIFPRLIAGKYMALSRADRESNGVTVSSDLRHWETRVVVQAPHEPWEIVQLGNCGPPIETEQGWLVLTHGVGPMREYSIGALLLDLEDPTILLGRLTAPLLSPAGSERSGYVSNVVYSCGAMRHGNTLVLPYGCSDSRTRLALVDVDALVTELINSQKEST